MIFVKAKVRIVKKKFKKAFFFIKFVKLGQRVEFAQTLYKRPNSSVQIFVK